MIRKRCLLFLKVAINYDKCDDTILYDMSLDAVILHRMYADSVERKFKKEFSEVLKNFRRVSFETKDMMGKMRATASDLSICCNYIMGLSFFLNAEFLNAEKVFEALWLRIQFDDKWRKMADSVNILRYKMFMTIALTHLDRYENQSAEKQDLLLTEEYLEKGNALIKNTYIYNLHKAYVCVAKNQDIKQARHYINMCKQTCKGDVSWKYSEAFLRAYEDRTIGSIVSGYKAALKVKYNIVNLIYFIEKVLEAHPERRGLHLALAILYEDNEDYQLAKEHFDLYVSSSENADKTKDILRKKGICCFGTVL